MFLYMNVKNFAEDPFSIDVYSEVRKGRARRGRARARSRRSTSRYLWKLESRQSFWRRRLKVELVQIKGVMYVRGDKVLICVI